jgi:hypothetical protein
MPQHLTWSKHDLAAALKLTERRITQLVAEGVLPTPRRHGFDAKAAVSAYITFSRKEKTSLNEERRLKVKVQRKREELRLKTEEGKLVDKFDYDNELYAFHRQIRDRIMNVPDRVSGPCAAEMDSFRIYAMLTKELHDALNELSGVDTRKEAEERERRKVIDEREKAERWKECKRQAKEERERHGHPSPRSQ